MAESAVILHLPLHGASSNALAGVETNKCSRWGYRDITQSVDAVDRRRMWTRLSTSATLRSAKLVAWFDNSYSTRATIDWHNPSENSTSREKKLQPPSTTRLSMNSVPIESMASCWDHFVVWFSHANPHATVWGVRYSLDEVVSLPRLRWNIFWGDQRVDGYKYKSATNLGGFRVVNVWLNQQL